MPYQHSLLVTYVIEDVVFILPTTPQAKHIVIGVNSCLYCFVINLWVFHGSRHEHIRWNIVRPPNEYWNSIQFKVKRAS
jgi:hypothetical protein